MDATVGDEVLECHAGSLATHWVETREHYGLGGVVDHEGHARDLLEGADVATLTTDDAALEVIGGDVNARHSDLAGLVGGAALDGSRDNLTSRLVGLGAHALLGVAQDLGLVTHHICTNAVEQLAVGVFLGEGGNTLKLAHLVAVEGVDLVLATVKLALQARELVLLAIEGVVATVERLLALQDAVLHALQLALALLLLGFLLLAKLEDLLTRFDERGLSCALCVTRRVCGDALCARLCLGNVLIGLAHSSVVLVCQVEVGNCDA